jgi:hypothetical protein
MAVSGAAQLVDIFRMVSSVSMSCGISQTCPKTTSFESQDHLPRCPSRAVFGVIVADAGFCATDTTWRRYRRVSLAAAKVRKIMMSRLSSEPGIVRALEPRSCIERAADWGYRRC